MSPGLLPPSTIHPPPKYGRPGFGWRVDGGRWKVDGHYPNMAWLLPLGPPGERLIAGLEGFCECRGCTRRTSDSSRHRCRAADPDVRGNGVPGEPASRVR